MRLRPLLAQSGHFVIGGPDSFEGLAISTTRTTMLAFAIYLGDVRLDQGNDTEKA
jgi:hypothetical protein